MLKLLISLVAFVLIAAAMLQLRGQKRELGYQISKYHSQIESRQAKLWNQQLQIAICTAPNAITQTVTTQDLKLAPPKVQRAKGGVWVEPAKPENAPEQ